MHEMRSPTPRAVSSGLIVEELSRELLVYDRLRHRAHHLNAMAAQVWRSCDGRSSSGEIAKNLNQPEPLIRHSLAQLEKAHLIDWPDGRPFDYPTVTRRMLAREIGALAMIAAVTSILAPTALASTSCIAAGNPCASASGVECCNKAGCGSPQPGAPFGLCN